MELSYITESKINEFITNALHEDVGEGLLAGDHSTLASIDENATDHARLLIKGDGIIAGVELAGAIFGKIDPDLEIEYLVKDGDTVKHGDIGLYVKGSARSILTAERLVLNCMQRMSGIASYTNRLVKMIEGTSARLLDTRKTTPNFRMMEKWAVVIGGGVNHRYGLYDMVMLKDNHVDYSGGITNAVNKTRNYLSEKNLDLRIEVETRDIEEVKEALSCQVDRIMLDNMTVDEMKVAVNLIDGKSEVEASGGINEDTIRDVAETGVDFISVGALTHSYKSLDISLKAV
ncbi:MAG: carboxylating nicotinate-nucleotide diphosphorylase [Cyclobacteriaceae bacterium]